jgi:putative DNA-invertase from lambdoid prophage Rac
MPYAAGMTITNGKRCDMKNPELLKQIEKGQQIHNKQAMKKAAIYIRVSTSEQTTENQRERLMGFCSRVYEVYKVYEDIGSGLRDDRPAFNEMMDDMRAGCFDAIIVWKLDRIGRSLQHLLHIFQEMQKKKIDFVSITQNIDTTTAAGKLLFHIIGAFAEFESSLISERTKLGMERARRQGRHIGRPKGSINRNP